MPQTKAKDDPNAAYLINSRPLRDSIEQKAPHKGIDIPSCFSFLWHNIKFSGQLSQAEKDDLFSVDLMADLGHIPFSAENNTHRQKLIADFTPRFRTGDYSLSKNSQIKKILQTDFSGPLNAKRLIEVITYVLLDQKDELKSVQAEITG